MAGSNSKMHVPVVDFRCSPAQLREDLARACEGWGLFHLVNHAVPAELTRRATEVSAAFFFLPLPLKQALSRTLDNPWGYYDRELTKNLRDRKEIFDFGPGFQVPWPEHPTDFRETLEAFSRACYGMALLLLDELGATLGRCAAGLRTAFEPACQLASKTVHLLAPKTVQSISLTFSASG